MTNAAVPANQPRHNEVGRYRRINKPHHALAVIGGNRVEKHWDDFVKDIPAMNRHYEDAFDTATLNDFYHGWVEPLMDLKADYCGCKATQFSTQHQMTFLNIRDIVDLALFSNGYIERLLPGSTREKFGSTLSPYEMFCNGDTWNSDPKLRKHGNFTAHVSPVNMEQLGVDLLAEGETTRFSMSLLGWDIPFMLTSAYESKVTLQRLSNIARSGGIPPLKFTQIYGMYIPDTMVERYGVDDGVMTALLILANGSDLEYDFTAHDLDLIHDDVFLGRLLGVISKNRNNAMQNGTVNDFNLIMRTAEHDIDVDLMLSL